MTSQQWVKRINYNQPRKVETSNNIFYYIFHKSFKKTKFKTSNYYWIKKKSHLIFKINYNARFWSVIPPAYSSRVDMDHDSLYLNAHHLAQYPYVKCLLNWSEPRFEITS